VSGEGGKTGKGTNSHPPGDEPGERIDAYLENWLQYVARRRQPEIDPERIEILERRFIEAARDEGLLDSAGGSLMDRIRSKLLIVPRQSPAEPMVAGRGGDHRGRRWWIAVLVLTGLAGSASLIYFLTR
jgi:hypothetical protein